MSGKGEKFVMTSPDEVRFGGPPGAAPFAFDPEESREPAGSEGGGRWASGGAGAGGGAGKPKRSRLRDQPGVTPLHLADHVADLADSHFRNMRAIMKGLLDGDYAPKDAAADVDHYRDGALRANHARHARFEARLGNRLEEAYGAAAMDSPQWNAVLAAVESSEAEAGAHVEDMADAVRNLAAYYVAHPGETVRIRKGTDDADRVGEIHDDMVTAAHAEFHKIFDAVDAFKAAHKPTAGFAAFAFNPGQSRGQPENAGQFGPGGGAPAPPAPLSGPALDAAVESEVARVAAHMGSPDGSPPLVPIWGVRDAVPAAGREAFDASVNRLRLAGKVRLVPVSEKWHYTPEQLAGGIEGANELFLFLKPQGPLLPPGAAPFAFDPAQPRVPAGSSKGGEWGSGGSTAVAEKPPGKKPRVDVGLTDREEAAVAKIVKGALKIKGGLTGEQLAALGGAPPDGQATVRPGKDKKSLKIHVSNDFTAVRHLKRLGSGELVMENESIHVKESEQGKGLGTEAFARQVEAARALGVGSIRCHAARYDATGGESFNGYSTWPKLGYDQDFEDLEAQGPAAAGVAAAARAAFPGVESVLQLMAAPGGKHWWAKNGTDLRKAKFDLSDGSDSMMVLGAYLEARKEDAARG